MAIPLMLRAESWGVAKLRISNVFFVGLALLILLGPGTLPGLLLATQTSQPVTRPLQAEVLNSECPRLPTASQLLSNQNNKLIIIGRNGTEPNIFNYTTTEFGYSNGRMYPNFNIIYVTDGKVWVQIPQSILQATGCSAALTNYNPSKATIGSLDFGNVVHALTTPWALGGYSDPAKVSGSSQVTGLMSYAESSGTWSATASNCPNSVCYLGYDVMTAWDNLYGYQLVLQNLVPGDSNTNAQGYDAVVQVWSSTGLVSSSEFSITFSTGQYYPMEIVYNTTATAWDFYFNGVLLASSPLVSGENAFMVTGPQPSVAVETDDTTQSDFSGFVSSPGYVAEPSGGSAGTCPCLVEPAISYYANSGWNPAYTVSWPPAGGMAAAYVYDGGSGTGFAFRVGAGGPPSWIGLSSPLSEELSFCVSGQTGCTTPSPAQGTKLWSAAGSEFQSAQYDKTGSSSFTVSFSGTVSQGDLIVAMAGMASTGTTFGVSDSQGNTWTAETLHCTNDCVQIFYATAGSKSSDTITFTTTKTTVYTYGFIVDFSGASVTLDKTSSGSSTSGHPHVTSFSPSTTSVVVDIAAGPTGWSAGTGYTRIGANTGWGVGAEYAVYWLGSTTSPWGNSGSYGEVASSFK